MCPDKLNVGRDGYWQYPSLPGQFKADIQLSYCIYNECVYQYMYYRFVINFFKILKKMLW